MNKLIFELEEFKRFISLMIESLSNESSSTYVLKKYLNHIIETNIEKEIFKIDDEVFYFFFNWKKSGYIELRKGRVSEIDYDLGMNGCANISDDYYGYVTDIGIDRLFPSANEAREAMAAIILKTPVED